MAELMTLPRMARRLGVTQKWLRQQAVDGAVPALKAGPRFLFSADAVSKVVCEMAENSPARRLAKSKSS